MAHNHAVVDSDERFAIDPDTRQITTSAKRITLIQHDHDSEAFSFEIPRTVEGHDMLQSNVVEVHFNNVDGRTRATSCGVYEVKDLAEGDDPDVLTFSWLVSGKATEHVGRLEFSVRFACVGDGGEIEYDWHTAVFGKVSVEKGIYNTDRLYVEKYDVLADHGMRIEAIEEKGSGAVDATLTVEGVAADAKAVGDALAGKQPTGDYLTKETDPTVPAWAKQPEKPSYTAAEVGALPADTVIPTVPENVSAFKNDAGYLTEHQSLADYAKSSELAAVAKSGSYSDLTGKPTIPTVPTAVSAFTNDAGYLTDVPSEYVTDSELAAKRYQTEAQVNALINTALGVIENGSY